MGAARHLGGRGCPKWRHFSTNEVMSGVRGGARSEHRATRIRDRATHTINRTADSITRAAETRK
eukprot:3622638-Rhodomonas_salina.1